MEDKDIYLVRFIRPENGCWEITVFEDPDLAIECVNVARQEGCVKYGVSKISFIKNAEKFSDIFDRKEDENDE